jgi:hypothetical protein
MGAARAVAVSCLLLAATWASAQDAGSSEPGRYRIETAVWSEGQLRGEPELELAAGKAGRFVVRGPESAWRIGVEVEPPEAHEQADPGALWLKVGIEQWIDGEWVFLTDTMLGTPAGEPGRISVVEDDAGGEAVGAEDARLFVVLVARPLSER